MNKHCLKKDSKSQQIDLIQTGLLIVLFFIIGGVAGGNLLRSLNIVFGWQGTMGAVEEIYCIIIGGLAGLIFVLYDTFNIQINPIKLDPCSFYKSLIPAKKREEIIGDLIEKKTQMIEEGFSLWKLKVVLYFHMVCIIFSLFKVRLMDYGKTKRKVDGDS